MNLLIKTGNVVIGVANGVIVPAMGDFDSVLELRDAEIRPGLINAHDHLHRNHYGRLGKPTYANAYDWAADIQTSCTEAISRGRAMPRRQALLRGAWKNLLSGVTHVVHHDAWETIFEKDFPIAVVRLINGDSLGMSPDFIAPPSGIPFTLHVAEGVDSGAAREVRTLAAGGLLTPDLLAVHAVGPDADGVARLRGCGCAIIWCPTSNHFLFGRSTPKTLLAEGMDVLLGTDSLLTGAGTLLDELRAARGGIADTRLCEAVGSVAARRLGIPAPSLTIGAPADLVVLRRPLLEADANDVLLVMAEGKLRVLDPDLVADINPAGGFIADFGITRRWISGPL